MANNNNKQTIWEPLFSSLAVITTFQQLLTFDRLWYNMPNEIAGPTLGNYHDYQLNTPPLFLRGLSLVLGSSSR